MNELSTLNLSDLLPSSIAEDQKVQALAKVATDKLLEINSDIRQVLLWDDLEKFDDAILSALAWQLHVDLYDEDYPKSVRANLIRDSILWHMKRGTLYSVEMALHGIFQTGTVKEWFDYGGEPYHFKIDGITGPLKDKKTIKGLVTAVRMSKNLRSWCDGIGFVQNVKKTHYIAMAKRIRLKVVIRPATVSTETGEGTIYAGGVQAITETIDYVQGG